MDKIKVMLIVLAGLYVLLCAILYFAQEKLLFYPTKLPKDYTFKFDNKFEEVNLKVDNNTTLNALLFKAKIRKGVVLFLHGNGGAIHSWGEGSVLYTENGYDVLYLDYRGYGKSNGKIISESQLIDDAQIAYDYLKQYYTEDKIIVSGTSIGTGIATQIAAQNNPSKLILTSPYYSLESLAQEKIKFIPSFIIKYKLRTNKFTGQVKCPVIIFHGDSDEVIPHHHSLKLKENFPQIDLHILKNYGHNDLTQSEGYVTEMFTVLSE